MHCLLIMGSVPVRGVWVDNTFEQSGRIGNATFSQARIASTLSSKVQQFIILPTEKCNFRCTYCYEDFAIGRMKAPVQQAIERLMDRRIPELSTLSINWFGGEPLVARDVVLRLSRHASRLARENGVEFTGGLTTNAYLLDRALFEELVSYNQTFFQITVDGWEADHDVVRRLANGRGTFSRIWQNLQGIASSDLDCEILIRIHVRRDNYLSLETLVRNIATTFGRDPRFSLDFEHLRNLGGEGGKSVERPLSIGELRQIEGELRRIHASALPLLPGDVAPDAGIEAKTDRALLGDSPSAGEPYICYAAKANSLLIRADGRIGKCTVALTDNRNTIGVINPDGTLKIDNDRLRPWLRGLANLDPKALECPLGGLPPKPRPLASAQVEQEEVA